MKQKHIDCASLFSIMESTVNFIGQLAGIEKWPLVQNSSSFTILNLITLCTICIIELHQQHTEAAHSVSQPSVVHNRF